MPDHAVSSTRRKRKRGRFPTPLPSPIPQPAVRGKSKLEQLPVELLVKIHFTLPSKLPVLSKTLLALLTPPSLSLRQIFAYLFSTKRFKQCKDNSKRTAWFFTLPPFLQTRDSLLFFLHELYFRPGAPYAHTLLFAPPFDPCDLIRSSKDPPAQLLHFVYHNLPTSAWRANDAVLDLLEWGEWELAKVFLECGAVPDLYPERPPWSDPEVREANRSVISPELERRVADWLTEEVAARTTCSSCGHMCRAQQPGPAQALILQVGQGQLSKLPRGTAQRFVPATDSRVSTLMAMTPRQYPLDLRDFMLPHNGTVGRHPQIGRAFRAYSVAKYRKNLVAEFVDEYLETLFRTFAELYTPEDRGPILPGPV